MQPVGGRVDCLPWLEGEVVHADERDEGAVVFGGILFLEAGEQIEDIGLVPETGAGEGR